MAAITLPDSMARMDLQCLIFLILMQVSGAFSTVTDVVKKSCRFTKCLILRVGPSQVITCLSPQLDIMPYMSLISAAGRKAHVSEHLASRCLPLHVRMAGRCGSITPCLNTATLKLSTFRK